jgi:tetratricopeptide (TPR) repeat protein
MLLTLEAFGQQTDPEKLIEAGHWKRARAVVETRLREAPDDPLANFLLSQIRNAFGERTTPLALAEKAAALESRVAKYHRQLAEVLGVQAQHAGALQQLFLVRRFRKEIDTAIALDPRDVQALRDLLEYYLLAPGIAGGDPRKAVTTAERIAEIDAPEGFLAKARIAGFHKQTPEREALLRKAFQAQPPSYRARIVLAHFYLAREHPDPEAALTVAKEALKLDRSRVESYAILARVYADRAEWSELEGILTEASHQVPDDLVPYYRAADSLLGSGHDPGRAERYLRAYLNQESEGNEPPAAEAHWKLGLALEAQGSRTGAVAEWRESLRLDPESPAARDLKRLGGSRTTAKG